MLANGFSVRLIERLEPWMTPDLEILCKALGCMFEPIEELAVEEGFDGEPGYVPAWGRPFEVQSANLNELRYLSQFVGASVPQGANEAEAREIVKAESGLARGTLASLEGAIRRTLKSSAFHVQERTNPKTGLEEAYWVTITIPKGKGGVALYAAINEVIPAGILYEVIEVENAWIEGGLKWSEVKAGLKWSTPPVEGEY